MATPNEPKIQLSMSLSEILRPVQWGALALGALLIIIGFSSREYGYLICACFLGIVSRIAQAEYYHSRLLSTAQSNLGSG